MSQIDRINNYGDAVRLIHDLKRRGADSATVKEAQGAADLIKQHVNEKRTTPIRKTPMAEKLFGISARPTRAERAHFKKEGFWKKIF